MKKSYQIKAIFKESREFMTQWKELWGVAVNANIFNSPEWFKTCINARKIQEYTIYACYENKKLVGVLPLVRTRRFGISTLSSLCEDFSVDTPLLVKRSDTSLLKLFLGKLIKDNNIFLSKIDPYMAKRIRNVFPKVFLSIIWGSPYINIDVDPLRFISKSNLKEIERIVRNNPELKLEIYDSRDNLQKYLRVMFKIDTNSGKKLRSRDIFSKKKERDLYSLIVKNCSKHVKAVFLYCGKVPIAYIFGFEHNGLFLDLQTSYLTKYRRFSPGKVILYLLLKRLKDEKIKTFDFCGGVSFYKLEFAPNYYFRYDMYYSNNWVVMFWWRLVNTARKVKKKLFPEKYTIDHKFQYNTDI